MNTVTTEMNTVKDLVSHVLCNHPQTRNNDTLLYLECCKVLGAKNINDMVEMNLSIISVHKIRQQIQNKDKMFLPDENVKEVRKVRKYQIREYMRKTS